MIINKPALQMITLLFVISFIQNIHAQTEANGNLNDGTETQNSKYTIDNCISHFSMDKTEKTAAGYQFWYVDKKFADGKTLKLSVVKPHQATHAPHKHSEDEFFFIIEGDAEVYLSGTWRAVGPNTSFYCPSNVEHGIRNPGDTELSYLVIKQYPK